MGVRWFPQPAPLPPLLNSRPSSSQLPNLLSPNEWELALLLPRSDPPPTALGTGFAITNFPTSLTPLHHPPTFSTPSSRKETTPLIGSVAQPYRGQKAKGRKVMKTRRKRWVCLWVGGGSGGWGWGDREGTE